MKIILVTIDTLRADRVGCYGYPKDTTPNIDRLASEGASFRHAFSPCTYTIPSHAAILTGKYPGGIPVFFSQREVFNDKDRELMLQEVLADRGYETAAFVSSLVLRREWGLDSGFGLYDDKMTVAEANRPDELIRPGTDTNRALFAWLSHNKDADFFAWVHYFDVHGPYVNPEPFASLFRPEDYGSGPLPLSAVPEGEAGGIPNYQLLDVARDEGGAVSGYERDARRYFAQYDAGVRVADEAVGGLVQELKRLGIYDDTALVVTADHGEAMGEGGVYFFHGLTATPDQVKVPLVMKLPGGAHAGFVGEVPVSTIDIMPALLDLAGIDASGLGLDGVPMFRQKPDAGRFILSENEWQRAVISDGLFLLREKDVIRDGFTYYYDSKDLCVGDRLFDSRTGAELPLSGAGARKEALWEFSETLRKYADPREAAIRAACIERGALLRERHAISAERDALIHDKAVLQNEKTALRAEKTGLLSDINGLRAELKACRVEVGKLNETITGMRASLSWRVTGPLRMISALLPRVSRQAKRLFAGQRSQNIPLTEAGPVAGAPLVSVVIPVYDRVQELKESIESILGQTYRNIELIIVTDGSPKNTLDVVESYRDNPRVRIFLYPDNSGNAVRGRNTGISEARGEYVAFQDSDDIAAPQRIEKSVMYIEKYGADVVYGGWRAMLDGTRTDTGLVDGQEVLSPDCDLEMLKEICVPCQSTVMARRAALVDVGGLKPRMRYREDHELWLRLAYFGYRFKAIPEVLTNLRLHGGNLELSFKEDDERWRALMLEEYALRTGAVTDAFSFEKVYNDWTRSDRERVPGPAVPLGNIKETWIRFLLPGTGIAGGIAVVFQHADRLLARGYKVELLSQDNFVDTSWFPELKAGVVPYGRTRRLLKSEDTGVLIATGWQTAFSVDMARARRKLYFVQSDESRFFPEDEKLRDKIRRTYALPFVYFTEARWIQSWLKEEYGHDSFYVPNGLDTSIFHPDEPFQPRSGRPRVLLEGPIDVAWKGMAEAFEAVKDLDCEVWAISSLGRPRAGWRCDRFFERVPMREMSRIYSSCDIFLKMSRVEGFFGPPMEAMACGCVPVVSKVTGYDEYIRDGFNALVVEPGDVTGARRAVKALMDDKALRERLIRGGFETSGQWTWERSVNFMEEMLGRL